EALFDPNVVKVVVADNGQALYFSRAPVPWHRDAFARGDAGLVPAGAWLRHIGIYAYRAGFLRRFATMPPGRLERIEALEPLRLLVVCLGNICRSPLAEGLLRHHLEQAGLGHRVELDSAGTSGWHIGNPPDPRTVRNALGHGLDLRGLRARQLRAADYHHFDWLLCADASNLADVRARAAADATARSALLLEWAGLGQGAEIPDPYTGGPEAFEHVFGLVDAAARRIVARLADRPQPVDA